MNLLDISSVTTFCSVCLHTWDAFIAACMKTHMTQLHFHESQEEKFLAQPGTSLYILDNRIWHILCSVLVINKVLNKPNTQPDAAALSFVLW